MKIIISLLAAMVGLGFCGLVAVICEDEERKSVPYDYDEDGGFMDDWRLP